MFFFHYIDINQQSTEKLPTEFDARVKAMEVDDAPTDDYTDIGGLDKQIQELIEAVVLPMTHAERFTSIGEIVARMIMLFMMIVIKIVMMIVMMMMMIVMIVFTDLLSLSCLHSSIHACRY